MVNLFFKQRRIQNINENLQFTNVINILIHWKKFRFSKVSSSMMQWKCVICSDITSIILIFMDFIISPLIINQISFLLIFNPSWQVFVLIAYNTCCFEDWRLELPSVIIRERERSACRRIIAGVYRCKHTGKLPHCIECDCFILCDSHNHSPIQKFLVQWYMYVDSMCYQYAVKRVYSQVLGTSGFILLTVSFGYWGMK